MENLKNPDPVTPQTVVRGISCNFAGQWTSIVSTSFKGSRLDISNFRDATMSDVTLTGTTVEGANFTNVKGLSNDQKNYLRNLGAQYVPN